LEPELNGIYNASGGRYGDVVSFQCDTGYNLLRGSDIRTCQSDTEWSGRMPFCESMRDYKTLNCLNMLQFSLLSEAF